MDAAYWRPTVTRRGIRMDIYDSMLEDGIIFVNAPIDQRIGGLIDASLLHLCSHVDQKLPPKLYLNTDEGDVVSAMSVVDVIERYKRDGVEIETLGLGNMGVAVSLVVAAGSPGRRRVAPHCQIRLFMGPETFGLHEGLSRDAKAKHTETLRTEVLDLFVGYTGKPADLIRPRLIGEIFLDATEAKKLNLIDATI